jgi:hypothetical protein
MKKLFKIALFLLCTTSVSYAQFELESTFSVEWYNPLNGVPFPVEIGVFTDDSNQQNDTLSYIFNGDTIFSYDTIGIIDFSVISDENYTSIFGPTAEIGPALEIYPYLLDTTLASGVIIESESEWDIGVWDTLLFDWLDDRNLAATPKAMGVQVAWQWSSHLPEQASMILSPTVPVIQGEDVDYASLPGNYALNMSAPLNPVDREIIADTTGVYIYESYEFDAVYLDFILDNFNSRPSFKPGSYNFNDFHSWVEEYFTEESTTRLANLQVQEWHPIQLNLVHESGTNYSIHGDAEILEITVYNNMGALVYHNDNPSDQSLEIPYSAKGLLFVKFDTKQGSTVKRIVQN